MTVVAQIVKHDIDERFFREVRSLGYFACDTETSGLDPKLDRIATVQLYAPEIGGLVLQLDENRPTRLCRVIEDEGVLKVFHHAMFDLRFMAARWGIVPANIQCTKVASKLLQPQAQNGQHSLQELLLRRLGVLISKDQRLSDWLAPELTPAQVAYAMADVEYLLPLLHSLQRDLKSKDLMRLFQQCMDFIPARVQLELGGWPDVFSY